MKLFSLYKKMLSFYGEQLWWPVTEAGETRPSYKKRSTLSEKQRFEICIGAILTQNTGWKNVMKALENLSKAKKLSCEKIANANQETLARMVKPSGYYNVKAKKIKAFSNYLKKEYGCSPAKMFSKPIGPLRAELLSLYGIGLETADDIILYAAEKPSFVVDAYTTRFLGRFFATPKTGYVEAKSFFELELPKSVPLFNEFHALLVEHGQKFCKKRPKCSECFLKKKCRASFFQLP